MDYSEDAQTPGYKTEPARDDIMRFFDSRHLPGELRAVAVPIETLATLMVCLLPRSTQRTTGLEKLLEAKDCFVRAALP